MPDIESTLPDVFSEAEIAAAAGVRLRDVRRLAASGAVSAVTGRYFVVAEAVRAVRSLRCDNAAHRLPFRSAVRTPRTAGLRVASSAAVHVCLLATLIAVVGVGAARPQAQTKRDPMEARLVFLVASAPGGGGGGGRHEEPPPAPAERKGIAPLRSPLPVRRPPARIDPPPVTRAVIEPPPVRVEPRPPIVAPVNPVAADPRDRIGLPVALKDLPPIAESHGPGTGDGVGSGHGTGLGEGDGNGIGSGSGGGTGGGPYAPGGDVTAPSIVREVKPDYTDDARRRNLEGDVDLQIIVRRDGTVGSVKVQQGLGSGLDQRAIDAVRQWRFSPARRFGTPVDVLVDVSVEFRLR